LKCSGRNPLFCLILGFWKASLSRNLGFVWDLPHFFYL
jgi:hypothetical protein